MIVDLQERIEGSSSLFLKGWKFFLEKTQSRGNSQSRGQ